MTRIVKLKPKKKLTDCPSEEYEQTVFVTWLKKMGYRPSASANGGSRHLLEAVKLKRMGVAKGYPDVFLPLVTSKYPGFFVEMKRVKGGKATPEQLEWIDYLRDQGYYADIANGADEAKRMFEEYISTMPTAA